MAKRELIDKKKLIRKMNQSNAFDISERMKFSNLIECQRFITEQEIVKPYLERLKRRMEARDDDNGGEPLNAVDRGYHWAYEHLCEEIDNLLSEQEVKE